MYYVYLLKDRVENRTYIGYTEDLNRRIREHRKRNPELVYYEAYKDEIDAGGRELTLKQRGQTVRRLKERLRRSLN